ncbi:MAG: hypothetical protein L0Y60_11430 [Beijerinckiaceae bacterium]|nr:hypothetical protein [Beijerinckiaceae bacterium]
MRKQLGRAVEDARNLPPETQDEIARLVSRLAIHEELPVALTAWERASIALSMEAAARGNFSMD